MISMKCRLRLDSLSSPMSSSRSSASGSWLRKIILTLSILSFLDDFQFHRADFDLPSQSVQSSSSSLSTSASNSATRAVTSLLGPGRMTAQAAFGCEGACEACVRRYGCMTPAWGQCCTMFYQHNGRKRSRPPPGSPIPAPYISLTSGGHHVSDDGDEDPDVYVPISAQQRSPLTAGARLEQERRRRLTRFAGDGGLASYYQRIGSAALHSRQPNNAGSGLWSTLTSDGLLRRRLKSDRHDDELALSQ